MKRKVLGWAIAVGLFSMPITASAQLGLPGQNNPYYRPAVSPYVNLARGGNAAANYYGGVIPQVNFAKQIQNLQTQQQGYMPQFGVTGAEEDDLMMGARSVTGHPTTFFNYGAFFGQSTVGNRGAIGPAQTIYGKKK